MHPTTTKHLPTNEVSSWLATAAAAASYRHTKTPTMEILKNFQSLISQESST